MSFKSKPIQLLFLKQNDAMDSQINTYRQLIQLFKNDSTIHTYFEALIEYVKTNTYFNRFVYHLFQDIHSLYETILQHKYFISISKALSIFTHSTKKHTSIVKSVIQEFETNTAFIDGRIKTSILQALKSKSVYNTIYFVSVFNSNVPLFPTHFKLNITIFNIFLKQTYKHILDRIYYIIFSTLLLLNKSNFKHNSTPTTIDIFLTCTSFTKKLPFVSNEIQPLTPFHSNNGYSYTCDTKKSIYIYREEDWKKVMLHELIHCLELDFSCKETVHAHRLKQKIHRQFPIVNGISINESLNEYISKLYFSGLNGYFKALESPYTHHTIVSIQSSIVYEILFSLFQASKVLNYFNIHYIDIFDSNRNTSFKETTNVFAYYILVSICMYSIDDSLKCFYNDETNEFNIQANDDTIHCLFQNVIHTSSHPSFINVMESIIVQIKLHKDSSFLFTTNKMILG